MLRFSLKSRPTRPSSGKILRRQYPGQMGFDSSAFFVFACLSFLIGEGERREGLGHPGCHHTPLLTPCLLPVGNAWAPLHPNHQSLSAVIKAMPALHRPPGMPLSFWDPPSLAAPFSPCLLCAVLVALRQSCAVLESLVCKSLCPLLVCEFLQGWGASQRVHVWHELSHTQSLVVDSRVTPGRAPSWPSLSVLASVLSRKPQNEEG